MKKVAVNLFVSSNFIKHLKRWYHWYAKTGHCYDIHITVPDKGCAKKVESLKLPNVFITINDWTCKKEIWYLRVSTTQKLLETYDQVIVSDLDAYWLRNISQLVKGSEKFDFTSSMVNGGYPYRKTKWRKVMCCGFQIFNSTPKTKGFLKYILTKEIVKWSKNRFNRYSDQGVFNVIASKESTKRKRFKIKDKFCEEEYNSYKGLRIGCMKIHVVRRLWVQHLRKVKGRKDMLVLHVYEGPWKRKGVKVSDIDKCINIIAKHK